MKDTYKVCAECHRKRERCRATRTDVVGDVVWVCRQCWRDLEYDKYLYDYRLRNVEEQC